jgi:ATP-dependent helicase/nuclease subunit A
MENPQQQGPSAQLTPSQSAAVAARGNVLVMAGAGTGKTHTLIQRCLACLRDEGAALDEILVVTFTEAAAAEMRQRLRRALEEASVANPADTHILEQLALFDTAHIGTLHSFCLKLAREHFYELGLDPDLAVLETGEAHLRAQETLEAELQRHYGGESEFDLAVQSLIQIHGGGRDEPIRALILRLHHYAQTRPDAEGWLVAQSAHFAAPTPAVWQEWLLGAIGNWRTEWLPRLEQLRAENPKAAEMLDILRRLPFSFTREEAADLLEKIRAAGEVWPSGKKTMLAKPLKPLLADTSFLLSLARVKESMEGGKGAGDTLPATPDLETVSEPHGDQPAAAGDSRAPGRGVDPLAEDWNWTRGHMGTLLQLARNFEREFSQAKLQDGLVDFHDLEQFALKLLWDFAADQPTAIAQHWRAKLRFVFVDEYQDINAAQDKIIEALSRADAAANRFLVGDVKQSIYRFRLADPKIFRDYARRWRDGHGSTLALAENFRSREGLLNWVNALFTPLMCEEFGGVAYDESARLKFGSPETRQPFAASPGSPPRVELLLLKKSRGDSGPDADAEAGSEATADLDNAEKEARLLAGRLRQLQAERHEIWDVAAKTFRPVEWRDMAVLLRAPGRKAEIYAREFDRSGIPLVVERGGFYQSAEIADLLSVLQLLDNPLQDTPSIAVLRSPLVGMSLDELAQIRLTVSREHFWTALNRSCDVGPEISEETRRKITLFLERFGRWRTLARQAPLVPCLETVLGETNYPEWLSSLPRGAQRQANVRRFLALAEQFDQFQQQGLHRFLKFIEVQREAETEPEVVPVLAENAVRLMSIHQSKGLEFPVVALADLAKSFNTQDRRAEIIFDETYGLCPRVKPPQSGRRYPSLPHWLAQQHQRREQAGEELRLLYVALTRARDTLLLTGSVTEKKWETHWNEPVPLTAQAILAANSHADWIGLWFTQHQTREAPLLHCRLVEESELAKPPNEIEPFLSPATVDDSPSPRGEGERVQPPESKCPSVEVPAGLPPLDDATRAHLQKVLTWRYGFSTATEYKAKTSVTALRRLVADLLEGDEAQPIYPASPTDRFELSGGDAGMSAEAVGTAHHTFLQHVRLENTGDIHFLTDEADRLVRMKLLSAEESGALDLAAIAAFWNSPEGRGIRLEAACVHRELPFTARFSPAELAALGGVSPDPATARELAGEFVVVQGVADLVVRLPRELWLVDFKTDRLAKSELPAKTAHYQPQLKLYAGALAKIYGLPVTRCWLHFLALGQTVAV